MKVERFAVPGPVLFTPRVHRDDRGYLLERWREDTYEAAGLGSRFVQDNLSRSRRGVLRGMHFQREPHAHGKLVSVVRGMVHDVVVDLRAGSPTYLQHVAVTLDDEEHAQLWVPPGFAHGFLAMAETSDVLYKLTGVHAQAAEGGLRWDDPALGIDWPLADLGAGDWPLVSPRDAAQPTVADGVPTFTYG